MKTIVFYLLGIPCILVGSRFAGLDKALIHETGDRSTAVVNETVDAAFAVPGTLESDPVEVVSSDAGASPEELVAVVVPKYTVDVELPATGTLKDVLVRPYQVVEKGALLAVLDDGQVQADLQKQRHESTICESKIREAKAGYEKTRKKLEIRRPLVKNGVINMEEYNDLVHELAASAEQITQSEAALQRSQDEEKKLENMLRDFVVTAPFSGKVKRVARHAGQHVQEGEALLEIESIEKQVRALVPSELSASIQSLTFHVEAAGGKIALTNAVITGMDSASGYQDMLFDLTDGGPFISNQPLAVYVNAAVPTPALEAAPALASR